MYVINQFHNVHYTRFLMTKHSCGFPLTKQENNHAPIYGLKKKLQNDASITLGLNPYVA